MKFELTKSIEMLENTPAVLSAWLENISQEWVLANEGENTWSAKEVVAHLVICEKTNWIVRTKIILSNNPNKTFIPIDMAAHFELSNNYSLPDLLKEFMQLRNANIDELKNLKLDEKDLMKSAVHPKLGVINIQQLLSAWVTHDLNHIAQISRVMAKQYKENVGPFIAFLKFLTT